MTRIALSAIFVLAVSVAGAAWATDTPPESSGGSVEAPCIGKPTQEQLHVCLQQVVDSGVAITLPTCEGRTGDELTECETRVTAYQKALAKVTGEPCYGFTGDKLTECQAAAADKSGSGGGSSKKGGLSKHEGTKMERMSDGADDEEEPGAATGAGNVRDVNMERMTDDEDDDE